MPPDQDLATPAATDTATPATTETKPAADVVKTDAPAGDAGSTTSKPAADSSPAEGDGKPASSTGTDGSDGGKAPGTALEAMFAARKKISEAAAKADGVPPAEGSPDSKEAGKSEGDQPGAKAGDAKPEGDEKKGAPARVKELLAERAELAPRAESFDQLQNWVREKGLSQEDFAGALEITALTKSDPHAALARLKPIYEALQKVAGDILPDDLAAKVKDGSLDEASARELAQSRSKAAISEANQKRTTEAEQRRREAEAAEAQAREVATATTAWEADWKKTDPDFSHKIPFVIAELKAMWATGDIPANKEAAVAQAKKARETVEARLRQMMPAPAQKTVVTGGSNPGAMLPVPKTSIEAMRMAQNSA